MCLPTESKYDLREMDQGQLTVSPFPPDYPGTWDICGTFLTHSLEAYQYFIGQVE